MICLACGKVLLFATGQYNSCKVTRKSMPLKCKVAPLMKFRFAIHNSQTALSIGNPHTLMYRFVAEAKRIWAIESHQVRLTTIQAEILFNVFYNLCGPDEIGQPYRIRAINLAQKLRLYDGAIFGQSKRIRDGRLYAAWALYNWET